MGTRHRLRRLGLALPPLLAATFIPLLARDAGTAVARWADCDVRYGQVAECRVLRIDVAPALEFLLEAEWAAILALPLGALGLALWVVALLATLMGARRRSRA